MAGAMKLIPRLLLGTLTLLPAAGFASERLFVQVPAILDPAAPIAAAVKRECGVESLVGNHALKSIGSARSTDTDQVGANKLLKLTILSVHGAGGGGWSGPKSMTVRADLLQGGQVVRTTVLQRSSTGGVFGGMSGTCAIMERIAVALGKDVSVWLSMPAVQAPPVAANVAPVAPNAAAQEARKDDQPVKEPKE